MDQLPKGASLSTASSRHNAPAGTSPPLRCVASKFGDGHYHQAVVGGIAKFCLHSVHGHRRQLTGRVAWQCEGPEELTSPEQLCWPGRLTPLASEGTRMAWQCSPRHSLLMVLPACKLQLM
ncbi:hypothetical protein WJX72_006935 [[Myrmecia] bisecta]|uniref:Uncharacterized protein n=1 Tax=[Myrmecia] bisecta TaxID=41462 RepID=A0AAW1PKV4_9CHLO